MKSDLSPTIYVLDEYEIPSCPSIMLLDVNLDIEIDVSGDWYVDELRMLDGNREVLAFVAGDWLFDLLVTNIYKDQKLKDAIYNQLIEA